MGKKYIIELEEDAFHQTSKVGSESYLYRVKGFRILVFDMTGVGKLTPYTEPDLEQVRKEAYEEGYDAGCNTSQENAYLRGANELWSVARKVGAETSEGGMSHEEIREAFGVAYCPCDVFVRFSALQAIERIKTYEEKQKELHIGDVVTFKTAYGVDTGIVVECHVPDVYPDVDKYIVWCGGRVEYLTKEWLTKTGVHFSEITSILQKIKEMKKE